MVQKIPFTDYIKLAFALVMMWATLVTLTDGPFPFLINIDLVFHEAGHVFFLFFGSLIHALGGTLMQIIIPTTLAGYFILRREFYSASVLTWWLGENFVNISVYIKDARARQLNLIGGGGHDWAYILGKLNLLEHDILIGNIAYSIGAVIMVASVIGAIYFTAKNVKEKEKEKRKKIKTILQDGDF